MDSVKTKNNFYWYLQVFGWGLMMLLNFWSKALQTNDLPGAFFIIEGLLFFIIGMVLSNQLRIYFHRIRLIEEQSSRSYFKAFWAVIATGIVFTVLLILLVHFVYHIMDITSTLKMSFLDMTFSALNITVFVLIWTILYVVIKSTIKLRNEKIKRLELEAALKEAQLNALKGQINPHFIFNSLNNIRALILENPEKSREMLTRMSEMLRASLNSDKTDLISISQELETVHNFIALSKIHMEERLLYVENIDESLLKAKIPPMTLQLLVENAIKHGISSLTTGGAVELSISRNEEQLHIAVINDGQMKLDNSETGVGLKNIHERLQILYGTEASLSLLEETGKVTARLILPLQMARS